MRFEELKTEDQALVQRAMHLKKLATIIVSDNYQLGWKDSDAIAMMQCLLLLDAIKS